MFGASDWTQTALLIAALVVAFGVILHKGIRPTAKAITSVERSLPVVKELTDAFHDVEQWAPVLKAMAAQFNTNGGSSLRDVVDRIESAIESLEAMQRTNAINTQSLSELQAQDRTQIAAVVAVVNQILAKAGLAELESAQLALNLKDHHASESADRAAIASDLADAHDRAEATDSTEAGAAADAAMRRDPDEDG